MLARLVRRSRHGTDGSPRSATWPDLVQFLLTRYGLEDTLSLAYDHFSTYKQSPQQDEVDYGQRLCKLKQRMGRVVPENVLLMHYVGDLNLEILSMVRLYSADHPHAELDTMAVFARKESDLTRTRKAFLEIRTTTTPTRPASTDATTTTTSSSLIAPLLQ